MAKLIDMLNAMQLKVAEAPGTASCTSMYAKPSTATRAIAPLGRRVAPHGVRLQVIAERSRKESPKRSPSLEDGFPTNLRPG